MEDKYYNNIKEYLVNNEIHKRVKEYSKNKNDLITYYNVGKELVQAGKHYGEGIIKEYSKKLTNELGKGYNTTNLKRFRQFYLIIEKGAPLGHHLTWSHYRELIPLDDINKINYYINKVANLNLSKRELIKCIKSNEYERLPLETREKMTVSSKLEIKDLIPNPIVIKSKNDIKVINEKILKQIILEDIDKFLLELGNNFCYIGNEYKIKLGNRYNYIDVLLYNIEYNCYVVVELKVTELKKEHIGQIEIYMNYIDSNLKGINQDKTIGLIICKRDNKYVIDYCSDDRILAREYELI